jgi:hypothetical protein
MFVIGSLRAVKSAQVKAQCILWLAVFKSLVKMQRAFKQTYNRDPIHLQKKTIRDLDKKFLKMVNVVPMKKTVDQVLQKQMLNE